MPPRSQRLRLILVLGSLSAFGPLTIDMYLPALPQMTTGLDASAASVQLTLSAFLIGLALGQLVLGPLSDTWGRRPPLLVGLVVYAGGSLACALAPTVELLVAARVVESVGAGAGIVIARAVVRDLYSGTEMTRFFSLLMLVNGLAPVLAPVVGGQLLRLTSWRGVFVLLTGLGVLLLVAVVLWLPETLPTARRTTGRLGEGLRVYGRLLTDRPFMGYALSSGLMFAAMFAYIAGSTFVLQELYGLSPQAFSLVFAVNSLGIIALSQVTGALAGRVGERALLGTGLTAGTAGGVGVLLVTMLDLRLWTLLLGLFVVVASVGLVSPSATSLALGEHGANAGSASALLGMIQFAFGGVAAPLVGIAGSGTAVPMGAVICGFALAALLAFLVLAGGFAPRGAWMARTTGTHLTRGRGSR